MPVSSETVRSAIRSGLVLAASSVALASVNKAHLSMEETSPVGPRDKNVLLVQEAYKFIGFSLIGDAFNSSNGWDVHVTHKPVHSHHTHHSGHNIHYIPAMPEILQDIGGCESNSSQDAPIIWNAQNPTSTASGGFQELDSTWNNTGGYSRAMYAPPAIQVHAAEILLREQGTSPWVSSEPCWG